MSNPKNQQKTLESLDAVYLAEIVDVLYKDGLIIFPTDTVYGIACNAFSKTAIVKLFSAKERSFDNPIGVLTDSIEKVNLVANIVNDLEKDLIKKYFPGNLTLILNKKSEVPDILTANRTGIGVRIPNHKLALQILRAFPYPLATTSVNLAGRKEGVELSDFLGDFENKVDIIVDGGRTTEVPSTIIDATSGKIKILRQGSLVIR